VPSFTEARQDALRAAAASDHEDLARGSTCMRQHHCSARLRAAAWCAPLISVAMAAPVAHAARLIAYTPLASPGETVEVTFTMPAAGGYTFVCRVPGHYSTMLGMLWSLE
jgi:hypothetical protein